MNQKSLLEHFQDLKNNRWNLAKTPASLRLQKLQTLRESVLKHSEQIKEALYKDFSKPAFETELTEISGVLEEIHFVSKNLKSWMKPSRKPTPLTLIGTRSETRFEAKGVCLILSPWNYPFYLLINPLISAVAAGNAVVLKPSEKVHAINHVIQKIISECFSPDEVFMIEGDARVAESLLELPFDHIFFTGSPLIGKKVMAAAAKNLTSVTLELGGKSPVIIDQNADLEDACKKIIWSKMMNAGQTCVAPDYILIHESIKEKFIELCQSRIQTIFGENFEKIKSSGQMASLVDERAYERLSSLTEKTLNAGAQASAGGLQKNEKRFFAPTILNSVQSGHAIMQEEIFGPILPVMTYRSLAEAISFVQKNEKPLALYIFSRSKKFIETILSQTSAGGTVINNLVLHLANPNLPFGGVGHSGMGSCHGFYGFKSFSHERAIMHQSRLDITSFLYPPYRGFKNELIKKILSF